MIAYKGTRNMSQDGITFEVGNTYEVENLTRNTNLFIFHKNKTSCPGYYTIDDNFVLLEIEVLGDIDWFSEEGHTNKMKVLRVVPESEYTFLYNKYEYDDRNNLISEKHTDGYSMVYEYDDRNNKIAATRISETGYKITYEYDERNNKISETQSNGRKYLYEYDDQNNVISKVSPDKTWKITITR